VGREPDVEHSRLPTVSELQNLVGVGRGAAAQALRQLYDQTSHPQLANSFDLNQTTNRPTSRTIHDH
jgi:hypothetical protein